MDNESERTVSWNRPVSQVEHRRVDGGSEYVEAVQPGSGERVVNVNSASGPDVVPAAVAPAATALPVAAAVWRTQRVIYYIAGVIEAIVAIRLALRLLAANPDSPFARAVYNVSWVFVFPFNAVVPNLNLGGGSVLETFSVVAILVYALVAMGLAKLISLLL